MRETFTLTEPVVMTIKGPDSERQETVSAIEFDFPDDGRLRAGHLRVTDGHTAPVGMTLALAELFGDQPMKVLERLTDHDFTRLYLRLEDFRKPGRQTGETA